MKAYSEDLRIDKDGGETLLGPYVVLARSSLGAIRPVEIGSGRYHLTPLLTPLRAQHAETSGNRQQ